MKLKKIVTILILSIFIFEYTIFPFSNSLFGNKTSNLNDLNLISPESSENIISDIGNKPLDIYYSSGTSELVRKIFFNEDDPIYKIIDKEYVDGVPNYYLYQNGIMETAKKSITESQFLGVANPLKLSDGIKDINYARSEGRVNEYLTPLDNPDIISIERIRYGGDMIWSDGSTINPANDGYLGMTSLRLATYSSTTWYGNDLYTKPYVSYLPSDSHLDDAWYDYVYESADFNTRMANTPYIDASVVRDREIAKSPYTIPILSTSPSSEYYVNGANTLSGLNKVLGYNYEESYTDMKLYSTYKVGNGGGYENYGCFLYSQPKLDGYGELFHCKQAITNLPMDSSFQIDLDINLQDLEYKSLSFNYEMMNQAFAKIFWRYSVTPIVNTYIKFIRNDGGTPFYYTRDSEDHRNTFNAFAKTQIPLPTWFMLHPDTLDKIQIVFSCSNGDLFEDGVRILLDTIYLSYTKQSKFETASAYQMAIDIPFANDDYELGLDLDNNIVKEYFKESIESITISVKADFPTYDTGIIRYFDFWSPTYSNSYLYHNAYYWNHIPDTSLRYNLLNSESSINKVIQLDSSDPSESNLIDKFVDRLKYFEIYGSKYIFTIFFVYQEDADEEYISNFETTQIKVDYINIDIEYKISDIECNYGYEFDREDESKVYWNEEIEIPNRYGLNPSSIDLNEIPTDWDLDSYDYIKNEISYTNLEEPLTNSYVLEGDYNKFTFELEEELITDFHVKFEAPNYLQSDLITSYITSLAIGTGLWEDADIELTDESEFMKYDEYKIETSVSGTYLSEEGNIFYYIENNLETLYSKNFYLKESSETDFEGYIDLSEIDDIELGTDLDQFLIYFNQETPDEIGFRVYEDSIHIRDNMISNPTYNVGDYYFNWSFTTNAESEYSAIILQKSTKGDDYVGDYIQYYTGSISNNINFTNAYIKNELIKAKWTGVNKPNPEIELEFENLDTNSVNLIVDEVSIVPYFYQDTTYDKLIYKKTDIGTINIAGSDIENVSVEIDFEGMNTHFMRGIYTIFVKFHEDGYSTNEFYVNNIIFAEMDTFMSGSIYNYTIIEGLTGEQVLEGNFTKQTLSSIVLCYIMDDQGWGSSSYESTDHSYYYGNQFSPTISIQTPISNGQTFKTSYISVGSYIDDPNDDLNNTLVRLWNSQFDTGWLEYNLSAGIYYLATFNPFNLMTGRLYVNIKADDDNLNFVFATKYIFVESYKTGNIDLDNLTIGKVNAYQTLQYIPCNIPINYSLSEQSLTYRFDLGEDYEDAKSYKIQRNPINIYYAESDIGNGITNYGRWSYWKFREYTETDLMQFTLNAPISTWQLDQFRSSLNHKEYYVRLYRNTNLRDYESVSIIGLFTQSYSNLRINIIDITGGINNTITQYANVKYGYIGQSRDYTINFTIPLVLENVDYGFKVIIDNDISEITEASSFLDVFFGALGGFFAGFLLRYAIGFINIKYKITRQNRVKNIAIFGSIGAVIGGILLYIL